MKTPFFSIIIPVLNEEKYLPRLLDNLVQQTFSDFEVIIVDGKSKDATITRAESYSKILPHLEITTSKVHHVCVQRNLGADKARADILIFMDADNQLPPWFLQGIKYRMEAEPADILSPYIIPDDDTPANKAITTALNLYMDLQMTIKPKFLLESCLIITKKCFAAVGGFDEQINFTEGAIFLEKAISLNYKVLMLKDPTYIFSLRRFQKYGTVQVISNSLGLQLMDLLGIEHNQKTLKKLYPMLGGGIYRTKSTFKKNKIMKYLKNIQKIISQW